MCLTQNKQYVIAYYQKNTTVKIVRIRLERICFYHTGLLQFCISTHYLPFTCHHFVAPIDTYTYAAVGKKHA